MPVEISFLLYHFVGSWVNHWCGLKTRADFVGSVSTWVSFRYIFLSDIVYNQLWTACT